MDNPGVDDNFYDGIYAEVDTKKESFDVLENCCYAETNSGTIKSENNPRGRVTTKEGKTTSGKKVVVIIFMIMTALLICTAGACIAFALKIIELQSETARLNQDFTVLKSDREQDSAVEVLHQNLENLRQESAQSISYLRQESAQKISDLQQECVHNIFDLQQESAKNISDTVALYQNLLSQDVASLKTEQEISSEAIDHAIEMIYHNISQSYSSLKIDIGILEDQTIQNISGTAIELQS
jgi:hypothetical protein